MTSLYIVSPVCHTVVMMAQVCLPYLMFRITADIKYYINVFKINAYEEGHFIYADMMTYNHGNFYTEDTYVDRLAGTVSTDAVNLVAFFTCIFIVGDLNYM